MDVAMIFDGLQTGGIERVGADYAQLLIELGHTVTVININPLLTEMEREFPKACKIVHFNYPRKLAPEQYTQLIKRNGLCKVVYPAICAILDITNLIYKTASRRKKELRKQYDLSIAFAGHFNDLTFVSKNYVKARKKMCWLHGALYSYLLISDGYLNLYKKIKNLVVLVDDAQEEVLCYNKNLNLNINKLYNPTFIKSRDIDSNIVEELKRKYGKFMIMVSRFEYPHKDHYTVAKALEIVRCEYKEDINLLFLGTGPEEVKVKKYVESLSDEARNHIFFMGNQREVQNYYKAAYMLVHASVAGEGLPTIMLEAMAYELPMVVTDSKTGPREILQNNEFGLLCRIKDPQDMASNIVQLCKNDDLYRQYQSKSKIRIKDFEPETIKQRLVYVLDSIMNR